MTDGRLSQGFRLTVGAPAPPARLSQAARLTIGAPTSPARISQAARLVVADGVPCVTTLQQCWRIVRRDGRIFTFTSLDEDFTWGNEIYKSCASLTPSASESQSTPGGVGSMELSGILSSDGVSEDDLYGGLFDDAFVEVWLVDYEGSRSPRRIASGWVGNVTHGERGFIMETVGAGARLNQVPLVKPYTPSCRWKFGGKECGVDIESKKLIGSVISATDRGVFLAEIGLSSSGASGTSGESEGGGAQWTDGRVRWTTGKNAGVVTEIQKAVFGAGQVEVTLWVVAPFHPEADDEFDLLPGCDLLRDGGCTLYDNVINFGGFPDVPGGDVLQQTPNAPV